MQAIAFLLLGFFSSITTALESVSSTETSRLNAWLDARYEEELLARPMALTRLGRKESYGQIDDMSEAASLAKHQRLQQSVAQMQQEFAYEQLSEEGKISYDYWIYRLYRSTSGLPYKRQWYLFTQMHGAQTKLPRFLINLHSVDSEQDMLDYIRRIQGIGQAIKQLLVRAQLAAEEGIRPPRFAYETVIKESIKLTAGAPFERGAAVDSPLWSDAKAKIAKLENNKLINAAGAAALRDKAATALRTQLLPAYQELITWLRVDLALTDIEPQGAYTLPEGPAYYQYRLEYNTTRDVSPQEIHAVGLEEVARIRTEMEAIKKRVGFEGSLQQFFKFVRNDEQFFFANDDEGRSAYIAQTEQYLDDIQVRLPDYFGILPKGELVVKRVEPFREQAGAAAHYTNGTADGSRPGTYYLHLSDMSVMNNSGMETTAYHEGSPGHHMQIAIALEREELPLFRTSLRYSAFTEGWALYAEYLAKEMGAFTDPYSDFGRLVKEMWRAVRLVVDTGIHAQGWSEQRAVEYMMANTPTAEVKVRSEIRRYFVWPGQATAYKMGMLNLLALREQATVALGEHFDIRGFHDAVLGGGSLPVPLLERRVNNWIAATLSAQQTVSPSAAPVSAAAN